MKFYLFILLIIMCIPVYAENVGNGKYFIYLKTNAQWMLKAKKPRKANNKVVLEKGPMNSKMLWLLTEIEPGVYKISHRSRLCLEADEYNAYKNGSKVRMAKYNGRDHQLWRVEQIGNRYTISNKLSGLYLEASNFDKNSSLAQLSGYHASSDQLWSLHAAPNFPASKAASGRAAYVYSSNSTRFWSIDVTTGNQSGKIVTEAGLTWIDYFGMARHPSTGVLYAVIESNLVSNRALAIIDVSAKTITDIGSLGAGFVDIAFDASGNLFAVTGNDVNTQSLFSVNITNASTTFLKQLNDTGDGSVGLAYHPGTGLLYRYWGGDGSTALFQSITTSTPYTETAITTSGLSPYADSLTYSPALNSLLISDYGNLYTITSGGNIVQILGSPKKAIAPGDPIIANGYDYIMGDWSNKLTTYNITDGTLQEHFITSAGGFAYQRTMGLAQGPNKLYALTRDFAAAGSQRFLTTIDMNTDIATLVGSMTSIYISDLAFVGGQLYGVTGRGGTLNKHSLYSIDTTTGAATLLKNLPNLRDNGGEGIAYNSRDGKLYRLSGQFPCTTAGTFEAIDPVSLNETINSGLTGDNYGSKIHGLCYNTAKDIVVMVISSTLYEITSGGFVTQALPLGDSQNSIEYAPSSPSGSFTLSGYSQGMVIHLKWEAVNGAISYAVQKQGSNGFTTVITKDANSTDYSAIGEQRNTYSYRVVATTTARATMTSNTVSITTGHDSDSNCGLLGIEFLLLMLMTALGKRLRRRKL